MREIKFRAWDKKRKRMYEVLHLHVATVLNGGAWATVKGRNIIEDKDVHSQIQPEDIQLMQYTGLKDKNGKEVYECDIVRIFHGHPSWIVTPFLINFQNHAFALKRPEKSGSTAIATYLNDCVKNGVISDDDDESILFEVIGNIYEHPELLNQ